MSNLKRIEMSSYNAYTGNPLFSQTVSNVINALTANPKDEGILFFPRVAGWTLENARVKVPADAGLEVTGALRTWFRDLIGPESTASMRIKECAVESDIAVLATLAWRKQGERRVLHFCRMQVLVTRGINLEESYTLEDFYLGSTEPQGIAHYYRLEMDLSMPGPLYKEPLPHVHSLPDGPPRFPFIPNAGEFLPVSFLEFIYLNHAHDKWQKWAKKQCKGTRIPFENIVAHFEKGVIFEKLDIFRSHLEALKLVLQAAKRSAAEDAPGLSDDLNYLSYVV